MTAQLPEPSPHPVPPGELRASHDDREAVVEQLRDAAAEGRLDLEELDSRLEQALLSKTYAELAVLTADLPKPHSPGDQPLSCSRAACTARPEDRGAGRFPVTWWPTEAWRA